MQRISAPFAFVKSGAYLPARGASDTLRDMGTRSAKPTQADRAAAARLRAAWDRARETRKITQAGAAQELNISQPAVSQYLQGKIPLGFDKLMSFAKYIGCDPGEIRGDLPEQRHLPNHISAMRQQNDITAIQLAMRSLVRAVVLNIPAAAGPFVTHLVDQAKELSFSVDAGLLADLLDIAEQDQRGEAKAVPLHKRRGSAA